jgi:hypothetical protein
MVVDHDVDVELLRHRLVDELKELLELDGPVLRCELMSDLSGGQIEGGVEVDRPVALVVVTLALRGTPGNIGKIGWVRSSACTWVFSSTQRTMA